MGDTQSIGWDRWDPEITSCKRCADQVLLKLGCIGLLCVLLSPQWTVGQEGGPCLGLVGVVEDYVVVVCEVVVHESEHGLRLGRVQSVFLCA